MLTFVESINVDEHRSLCALVLALMPSLKWRHNGLGLLQAYIREGVADEMRVHVWHPSLRREGIEKSGLIHDHRFAITSQVLVGTIAQYEYDLFPSEFGYWVQHEVVHARAAMQDDKARKKAAGLLTLLPGRFDATILSRPVHAGQRYGYPKRAFHHSNVKGLAVTILTKSDQDEIPARILAPHGEPVVHAFSDPLPESAWQAPLVDAREALDQLWRFLR